MFIKYSSLVLLFTFCFLFLAILTLPLNAEQVTFIQNEDFFIAPLTEINGYGMGGLAYGGGISIGAGTGGATGINILYTVDNNDFIYMELNFFLRVYIFGKKAFSGPFMQLGIGPVIYADKEPGISGYGNFSTGLTTGWRFLLGRTFFLEPAFRIGYPYFAGVSFSLGVKFGSGDNR